jgi:hypothetical protein
MNYAFKVKCDECAVTLTFGEGKIAVTTDMTPAAARALAQDLIDKAELCEDAEEHYELEQMR